MTDIVTVRSTVNLAVVECYSCGMLFGLPQEFNENRLADKKGWLCPNGHRQSYLGAPLRDTLRAAELRASNLHASNVDLAKKNERLRKTVTSARQHAKAGMCTFCRRTFKNVKRHVDRQHPGA